MAAPVRRVAQQFGKPRFVITDHGRQFQRHFRTAMRKTGITCVQARVRAPYLSGVTSLREYCGASTTEEPCAVLGIRLSPTAHWHDRAAEQPQAEIEAVR